jgi:3-oxoadipate enol-lactonase
MRSETFPYPDRFFSGPHGPLCYFDTGEPKAGAARADGREDGPEDEPRDGDPGSRGGARPQRPPMLMLHALGINFTQFEYVAPALAADSRIVGLDMPGCGHSAKPRRPWRIADVTAATVRLLDHLQLERVVVLGHSFGGRVALELALRHPDRVLGLVLLNSAGLHRFPSVYRRIGPRLLTPNVVAGMLLGSFRYILQFIFSKPTRKTARAQRFMHQVLDRYDPRFAWEFAYHACPLLAELTTDLIDELPRITVPTQVVWGEADLLLRLHNVRSVLKRMPRSELVELPEIGHMPTFEHPEAVIAAVHRLFRALDAQPAPPDRGPGGLAAGDSHEGALA